jgi:hypothetical protein
LNAAINETEADLGGTEMGAAFGHVFDLRFPETPGAPEADVLVITDGAVWGVQNLLARTCRSGHRIYALGVGSAPAASLLNELADDTGGACEFVTPNEDMVAAMRRLLARMRVASAVEMALDVAPQPVWASPLPRRVADDETVHVHLRLSERPGAAPRLRFDDREAAPSEITWLSDDLVARIVAARQISHVDGDLLVAEIAERYQLVTEHTNLLLVFQRADTEKTDGMPALRRVRPMVAAGAGGLGSVLSALAPVMASVHAPQEAYAALNTSDTLFRIASPMKESLASSRMDELDIPAFLRKQDAPENKARSSRMRFGIARTAEPVDSTASHVLPLEMATVHAIVSSFNSGVRPGLPFRIVLHSVVLRAVHPQITSAIEQAAAAIGTRLQAWACFLNWVHRMNAAHARLSDAALNLVIDQLRHVDDRRQNAAIAIFEAMSVKRSDTAPCP